MSLETFCAGKKLCPQAMILLMFQVNNYLFGHQITWLNADLDCHCSCHCCLRTTNLDTVIVIAGLVTILTVKI
jgi:hypothetical protein